MYNFWQKLKKPFLVQAPMEDVTDVVFREIIATCGKPDVFFTEFVNVDGIVSGVEKVRQRLKFTKNQHPIVAQIWGNNSDNYVKAIKIIREMDFDGIDINMGCPIRQVVRRGCCAGLIKTPTLAKEIIEAAKTSAGNLPLSVKTRLGFNCLQTEEWIGFLLQQNLAAITVHGRIAAQMSKFEADWEEIKKAVDIRNQKKLETLVIGNGDVKSYDEAMEKAQKYGVDGVMIGRGILQNPGIFSDNSLTPEQKNIMLIDHLLLFDKTWGKNKNFDIMKKFYKMYISDTPHAQELRMKLMELKSAEKTIEYLVKYNHEHI